MDFASLLKTARAREKLSQSQAARKWDIALNSLQNWEQSRNAPSGPQLMKLLPIITPPAEPAAKPKPARKPKR